MFIKAKAHTDVLFLITIYWAPGNHNFWQTERYEEHHCDEIQPTFVLYNQTDDTMLGFGFTIPGAVDLPRYESPPNAVIGVSKHYREQKHETSGGARGFYHTRFNPVCHISTNTTRLCSLIWRYLTAIVHIFVGHYQPHTTMLDCHE